MIEKRKQELREVFWEWYYDTFVEEVCDKEIDLEFREKEYDKIFEKFADEVGF